VKTESHAAGWDDKDQQQLRLETERHKPDIMKESLANST
jgi:hypothetical protein